MANGRDDLVATRGAQMFPRLSDEELERLSRFGERQLFRAGDTVARLSESGLGLTLVLSGTIEVSQVEHGERRKIATHERGNFLGELAQLSGRPYLVDADAVTDVEAIAISPQRLRALLIAEADLG